MAWACQNALFLIVTTNFELTDTITELTNGVLPFHISFAVHASRLSSFKAT